MTHNNLPEHQKLSPSDDHLASFWDHVDELRRCLIHVLVSILLGTLWCLAFHDPLIQGLCKTADIPLKFFSPLDGITSLFKLSFWLGLTVSSPYWLYSILQFITPALNQDQKTSLRPFWLLSLLLFFSGIAFAWNISLPYANAFLSSFNQNYGENMWGFSQYLDYTLFLTIANGIAFESAAILLFLIYLGNVTASGLSSKRRHSVVAIFFLSAILTPPDVFTQLLLAIPLMGLYELTIIYARIRERKAAISTTN